MTVDEVVERYGKALQAQATANAEEAAAEDARKIILAKEIVAQGDIPVSKAENIARASQPYVQATSALNDARASAEEARAEVEHLKTRWETWRTKMASQREKDRRGG
jgi:hypothetical protein